MDGMAVTPVICKQVYVPQEQTQQPLGNCKQFAKVSINPKNVTEGVNEATKLIQSLTALLGAGFTLKEAIKVLFPQSNDKEVAQLSASIKACKVLDTEA